jgi:CBS domain-containing protein
MYAHDVMIWPVVTVRPEQTVQEIAALFVSKRISGAPVVDDSGKLVGIITQSDLMYRPELGTEKPHPPWFYQLAKEETLAAEYAKARARTVADVMTHQVVAVSPEATLNEIAAVLESKAINRVPVVEDGRIVGIVSRANLIQALASTPLKPEAAVSDATLRSELLSHLNEQRWAHTNRLNVIVHDGVVELWGTTNSDAEHKAIRIAAESLHGVRAVNDHLVVVPQPPAKPGERDITVR